jgi:hypothetical protein
MPPAFVLKALQITDAATKGWILQQLHSKTVLAHISAFPNKCNIKHPFYKTAIHEKSGNL